ncbi:MAG TPA: hypothetical protein DCR40_14940 [Prolixibacteraceae bacterium]|nr:hypothetical protein [Prolixibacteraceae bacterium]
MESGFTTYKDIFDVVIIPLTLALLAIFFPAIKSWHIRRRFKNLILRELKEIKPYPLTKEDNQKAWFFHIKKQCIHKLIFQNPTENRDFILSLPPDLVYYISNLWDPENEKDPKATQWKHYLKEIKNYFDDEKLNTVYTQWEKLIDEYQAIETIK